MKGNYKVMTNNLRSAYKSYITDPSSQTATIFADNLLAAKYHIGYLDDQLIVESDEGYYPVMHVYLDQENGDNECYRPVFSKDVLYSEKVMSLLELIKLMMSENVEIMMHGLDVFQINISTGYLISLLDHAYGTTYEDMLKTDATHYNLSKLIGCGVSAIAVVKAINPKYGTIIFSAIVTLDDVNYRYDKQLYHSLIDCLDKMFDGHSNILRCSVFNSIGEANTEYFKGILKNASIESLELRQLIDEKLTNKYLGIHEVIV